MNPTRTFIALLGFVLVLNAPVNGQKSFSPDAKTTTFIDNSLMECFYDYTVKAHPREDSVNKTVIVTYNTLLQANATVSKFWDWHSFKLDSILFTSKTQLLQDSLLLLKRKYTNFVKYLYIPVVYKSYPKGKITVIDEIAPELFLYEYPKTGHAWSLKNDTMTVCGYLCNKAVATYGGRLWTAWYTPEIAISDGPWKLYGLPGLILKAVDATGEHAFDAVVIRNAVHPIYLTKDFQRVKIGKEKFLKQKIPFDKDPASFLRINPAAMDFATIDDCILIINGHHTSVLNNAAYSPLELE